MKSLNNKGFLIAETLIVTTFLIVTLMFVYLQFTTVKSSYDISFRYDLVDGLYGVKNVEKYLKTNTNTTAIYNAVNSNEFVNITSCDSTYFTDVDYCKRLFTLLNVKTVIVAKENLTSLRTGRSYFSKFLNEYLQYIKYEKISAYRIIIEYNNETFASLKIS